jgi:hypothetical protein
MRRVTIPLLVLGALTVGGVARAGCCDDWFGCAATVVTGGLSCEIEETIATVQALATAVQTLASSLTGQTSDTVNQAQGSVGQAASDMGQVRQQSVASLNQAAQTAHDIQNARRMRMATPVAIAGAHPTVAPVNAPHSTMTMTVTRPPGAVGIIPVEHPADPTSVADALSRAEAYVKDLQTKGNSQAAPIAQAETAAVSAAGRHVSIAQQISSAVAMAPLNALEGMLGDLLSHPERIFDPSAEIDAQLASITNQIPDLLTRIFNEVTQEAMADLNNVANPLQQLQDSAEGGSAVVAAMNKVANSGTQPELDALNRLLPAPPPLTQRLVVAQVAAPNGIVGHHELVTAALARAKPTAIPIFVQRKAAIDDLNLRWQAIKTKAKVQPQVDAGAAQKVDHDFAQKFAGKTGADVEKTKQDLLAQAAKRFANEPKTLEKVRQYIETHTPGSSGPRAAIAR